MFLQICFSWGKRYECKSWTSSYLTNANDKLSLALARSSLYFSWLNLHPFNVSTPTKFIANIWLKAWTSTHVSLHVYTSTCAFYNVFNSAFFEFSYMFMPQLFSFFKQSPWFWSWSLFLEMEILFIAHDHFHLIAKDHSPLKITLLDLVNFNTKYKPKIQGIWRMNKHHMLEGNTYIQRGEDTKMKHYWYKMHVQHKTEVETGEK